MKKRPIRRTLTTYLNKYYKIQDKIMLVYRPVSTTNWSDRCLFLSKEYDGKKAYNHRSILENEVVIEFDEDDIDTNKKLAESVRQRLVADGFIVAKWYSGNKSTHLHTFIDTKECRNIPLLKNVFIRYYCEGLPLPDLRLCSNNHLIRAEYGVHEKTNKIKRLISTDARYPKMNNIKSEIWDRYIKEVQTVIKRRTSTDINKITNLDGFKYILTSHKFKEADDGRERALFMLIHLLKGQYKDRKDEFAKYLIDWYKYSGGFQLTEQQINNKLRYHWNKEYNITERYLNELLESIGKAELIDRKV